MQYFATQKKGEMHELRMELHSTDRAVKVDAVKKVIASMTVGKDVSTLFTDVLNCVQTGNIELKKLVYLYLINVRTSKSVSCGGLELLSTHFMHPTFISFHFKYFTRKVLENTTRINITSGQHVRQRCQ